MGVSPGTGPRSVSIRGMDVCFWILLLGQSRKLVICDHIPWFFSSSTTKFILSLVVVVIAFSSGIRSYRRTKCPLLVTLYKDGTVYYVVLLGKLLSCLPSRSGVQQLPFSYSVQRTERDGSLHRVGMLSLHSLY
jgi:hypothetical protein